jgi:hypothetical protein
MNRKKGSTFGIVPRRRRRRRRRRRKGLFQESIACGHLG